MQKGPYSKYWKYIELWTDISAIYGKGLGDILATCNFSL
jgi:hypothetical protein